MVQLIGTGQTTPSSDNYLDMVNKNMDKKTIELKAILIIWDECLHLPQKKLKEESKQFQKFFKKAFNHKFDFELPFVHISTPSIMFSDLISFEHEGELIEYKGKNKDLALIKYCSSGITDQTGLTRHVIVDAQNKSLEEKSCFPVAPLENWAVLFITSDNGSGMNKATKYLSESKQSLCIVTPMLIPPQYSVARHKSKYAGEFLAVDLRQRFKGCTDEGWLIDLT